MTPIVFDNIARMSFEGCTAEEQNAIAENVYTEHGAQGLLTLWACQDYYDPTEPLNTGFTPATAWWLADNNSYSEIVRHELAKLNEEAALTLLKSATFPPDVDIDMWAARDDGHMKLFRPEKPDKFSHASAKTVRCIAAEFFPQYPIFNTALCSIYLDVGEADPDIMDNSDLDLDIYPHHTKTLEAFEDDSIALQYLTRVHEAPVTSRQHASSKIIAVLSTTDEEWAMYDAMGLSPEAAYDISKNLTVRPAILPLPQEFNI